MSWGVRRWLSSWCNQRESTKQKANIVDCISQSDKQVEKESLETVPEKELEANEGANELRWDARREVIPQETPHLGGWVMCLPIPTVM